MKIAVKDIHPNPLQPRDRKVDVSDLVLSMGTAGLTEPIVIAKNAKGYVVIAGHRRLAAAIKLGWKELDESQYKIVDPADPKVDISRIMTTDVHQPLTGKEQAAGVQTMMDMGYTDEEMCALTGGRIDITAARKVVTGKAKVISKMPDQASIEEMAGLLEFEGSDSYQNLARAVGTDNFAHQLSSARQIRGRRHRIEMAHKELKDAGVREIVEEQTWRGNALRLTDFRLEKKKVTEENHGKCPGHCAFIDYDGQIKYYCDRPGEHGITVSSSGGNTGPKTDEQKAVERRKRQMRALWRASAPVRAEFISGQLKLKTTDAGRWVPILDWAYLWVSTHGVPAFDAHNTNAKDFTSSKDNKVRFVAACVGQVEKALEDWVTYNGCVDKLTPTSVAYLSMLKKLKYKMSDHEAAAMLGKEHVIKEA